MAMDEDEVFQALTTGKALEITPQNSVVYKI